MEQGLDWRVFVQYSHPTSTESVPLGFTRAVFGHGEETRVTVSGKWVTVRAYWWYVLFLGFPLGVLPLLLLLLRQLRLEAVGAPPSKQRWMEE